MAKWTREQTTLLLELYKQYPHLYDNRNLCYSDRNERQNTLLIIAKELEKIRPKTTVRDLKQKIRTIRTQYCVEKHKFHRSASKECYSPRLWCYDSLKFLDGVTPIDNAKSKQHQLEYQTPKPSRTVNKQDDEDFTNKHHWVYQEPIISIDTKKPDEKITEPQIPSNSRSDQPMICNLPEPITPTIHLAQKLAERINNDKKARNYAFAKFISEELDSIQDREILEDAKWDIQMTIRNALKQDRKRNTNELNNSFQSMESRLILSPSPSQSSSSACFHHPASVKLEMSEDDV